MKKLFAVVLSALAVIALAACGKKDKFEIQIRVPAGSEADFVYADEEVSPTGNTIEIWAGEDLGDTSVVLKPVEVKEKAEYKPVYLSQGMPAEMDAEKGAWFQIGVSVQNPSDEDMTVSVEVEGIEVRIASEKSSRSE